MFFNLAIGIVCGITSSIFSAYVPIMYSNIIQTLLLQVTKTSKHDNIQKYVLEYLIYKILTNLFASIRGYMFTIYIHKMTSLRKKDILNKLASFTILYFDNKKVTDNIDIITQHCEKISELYMLNGNVAIRTLTQIVAIIYIIYNISSNMLSFTIIMCIMNVLIQYLYHEYFYNKAIRNKNEKQAEQNRLVTDYITKIDTYRACGMDDKVHALFSTYQQGIDNCKIYEAIHYSVNMFLSQSINSICICSYIIYGTYIQLSYKDIHTFIMYMDSIIGVVDSVKHMIHHISNNHGSLDKINSVIKCSNTVISGKLIIPNLQPTIYLHDICFSYDKHVVINDMRMTILYGDKIGISAPSGKGKSTLLRLMIGLYEPCKGSVQYDNIDITTFDKDWFYQHVISYVGQEPVLLHVQDVDDTILEEYGEFAKDIPRDNPSNMSGGQKQRLAICKALSKKSSILVMDEPTASLDKKNEQLLQSILIRDRRTQIIVSHNIDFLKNTCNRIEYKL